MIKIYLKILKTKKNNLILFSLSHFLNVEKWEKKKRKFTSNQFPYTNNFDFGVYEFVLQRDLMEVIYTFNDAKKSRSKFEIFVWFNFECLCQLILFFSKISFRDP
jgi:hypothetical protein